RLDARGLERLVEADLLGCHRLDLDDLARARLPDQPRDDLVGLPRVAGPVHRAAAGGDLAFEPLQVLVEPRHRGRLQRGPGQPQLLPVVQLADDARALAADRAGGVAEVAPQLGVGERTARRVGERPVPAQVPDAARRGDPEEGAHAVLARISARWTVRVPLRSRDRPPPMCMRHDASPAVATSAPVASTLRILSASMAVDVSAFFSANVPPNPQHWSASGSSISVIPRTRRSSRSGLSPTRSIRSE